MEQSQRNIADATLASMSENEHPKLHSQPNRAISTDGECPCVARLSTPSSIFSQIEQSQRHIKVKGFGIPLWTRIDQPGFKCE
ncbi:hypothetical protein CYMTET_44528 [Cymbomonas tetramitiformis]|uniref:Uncharacterized protein n=1 Tax=Cymbomonas tetramitiformis TaxID=36881 RepID=A0AAE0C003_9CHLO|nr:hypothetical protein CYMTET_54917 [Cymbomonas tetramitiformis]KAK3245923.1 hypothetical protein CYMTET_44528 [Cymbomonas tetramitiformis]